MVVGVDAYQPKRTAPLSTSINILLAVDGSPYTERMLTYLSSHQTLFAPSHHYTVLTVQPQLPLLPRAR